MVSLQHIRWVALVLFVAVLAAACGTEQAAQDTEAAGEPDDVEGQDVADELESVTFVDTAGGANFQRFFNQILPNASEELGFAIDYVPSSAPEMQQRLQAQGEGEGDVGLLLLKPDGITNMRESGIEFVDLREQRDAIPSLDDVDPADLETALGVATEGTAAPFWRDQFGIIYDEEKIPDPPTSWAEFFERREEWAGHIGMIRPDADSGGGRIMLRDFLLAQGVDFSLPLEELEQTPEWEQGLANFEEFSQAFHAPLAAEPPVLFQQFQDGDVWISEYAIDFSLWSRDQGLLPDSVRASFFDSGHYGDAAYVSVPLHASEGQKASAFALIDWLLSTDTQVTMITEMWQYMGIERWEEVPDDVWEHIPRWEEIEENRIPLANNEAFDWLRENGMGHAQG